MAAAGALSRAIDRRDACCARGKSRPRRRARGRRRGRAAFITMTLRLIERWGASGAMEWRDDGVEVSAAETSRAPTLR